MPDSNLVPKLIERLISLTNEGKIEWAETASEDDFQATVGQYIVTASRSRNAQNWDAWDYKSGSRIAREPWSTRQWISTLTLIRESQASFRTRRFSCCMKVLVDPQEMSIRLLRTFLLH